MNDQYQVDNRSVVERQMDERRKREERNNRRKGIVTTTLPMYQPSVELSIEEAEKRGRAAIMVGDAPQEEVNGNTMEMTKHVNGNMHPSITPINGNN